MFCVLRRAARVSADAVKKILTSASGSTTVPISRPSTTIRSAHRRHLTLSGHQQVAHLGHRGNRGDSLGHRVAADLLDDVLAVELHLLADLDRYRWTSGNAATAAVIAAASVRSTPDAARAGSRSGTWHRCRGSGRPNAAANARETLDLPVPDGPSIATTSWPHRIESVTAPTASYSPPTSPRPSTRCVPGR